MTKHTCISCNEEFDDEEDQDARYSEKLDGWVCFPCVESNESMPNGTVVVYDPHTAEIRKYTVMDHEDLAFYAEYDGSLDLTNEHFCIDDYETCPIQFVYHSTDGWRGYYEPKSEDYRYLHSDCILSYSRDAEELKNFDRELKKMLWDLNVRFAICFGRTSNVFSCGYDMMVNKKDLDLMTMMRIAIRLATLKLKYRDPVRFRMTALTGKSEGFDKKDYLLAEASERLMQGEEFESVKAEILQRLQEMK